MSNKNRDRGHKLERDVAKRFRELGYEKCATSRYASRMLDDAKVDLCYIDPWYVQCKQVEKLGPLHNVLDEMPKEKGKINLVWHKRKNQGEIVAMRADDFMELVRLLLSHGIFDKTC